MSFYLTGSGWLNLRGLFGCFRDFHLDHLRVIVGSRTVRLQDGTRLVFHFNSTTFSCFQHVYTTAFRSTTRFVCQEQLSGCQRYAIAMGLLSITSTCCVCVGRRVLAFFWLFFRLFFRYTMMAIFVRLLMLRGLVILSATAGLLQDRGRVLGPILLHSTQQTTYYKGEGHGVRVLYR